MPFQRSYHPIASLLVAALLSGCAGAARSASTPAHAGPAHLSGTWTWGTSTLEPSPGPVRACHPGNHMLVQHSGESVTATVAVCSGPCTLLHSAGGTAKAGRLQLRAQPAMGQDPSRPETIYELAWNPQTQHLIGTRDGQPFWAAPFVRDDSSQCTQRIY